MCRKNIPRIDAPFVNINLEEKNDPEERFIQALDEYEVQGNFRKLLIRHFSDTWQCAFKGVDGLEKSLGNALGLESEPEKCILLLLPQKLTISDSMHHYFIGLKQPMIDNGVIGFLKDVAHNYYPNSPYGLFKDGMDNVVGNYPRFVSFLYGEEFFLSKEFFADKSLNALNKDERFRILWDVFDVIAHQIHSLGKDKLLEELISIASMNCSSGIRSKDSLDILNGFDFIKAWIKFDSQSGRMFCNWREYYSNYHSPWVGLKNLIQDEKPNCEESYTLLNKWLENLILELEKMSYTNVDLNLVSDEDKKHWASGIDSYYRSYTVNIYSDYSYSQLPSDELDMRLTNTLHELCSELTPLQKTAWIKYSIDSDFQQALNKKITGTSLDKCTDIWGSDEYIITLKKLLLEGLEELDIEGQLCVLSSPIPYRNKLSHNFYTELEDFWNNLFSHLIDLKDFPNKLIPDWTVVAINRLKGEDIIPYIDKSIGVIRGELLKADSKTQTKPYHLKLETLFRSLDYCSSRKALRHRLLLMRSSKEPFSDESISKLGGPLERENFYKWYDSLKQLSDTHYAYQTNGNREVTQDNYKQIHNDLYVNFSHELAEFCLSRLRLRKGEKAKDGKYDSSQVVEQSSIWRQAYLKALIELGFDLNGKIHKTVNFTKKSDPDKDVRAIASECYKAVRRHAKKNPSVQDIKRSIVAAEWWLLLCQRHELGLTVNHEEALKTRRNLMRNP